jgi:hypothetical protein
VGLEQGPLSLMSTTEELLGRNCSSSGLENRDNGRGDLLCWPRDTLYQQKLALTSPTSGGRSVGIVRLRAKATEFVCCFCLYQIFVNFIAKWQHTPHINDIHILWVWNYVTIEMKTTSNLHFYPAMQQVFWMLIEISKDASWRWYLHKACSTVTSWACPNIVGSHKLQAVWLLGTATRN